MKKSILLLMVALLGLTAFGQTNITKQVVVQDSVVYNQDSVPRVYFHIIQTRQDTLFNMNSTPAELTNGIKIASDRVRFTDQAVQNQVKFMQDSISDKQAKQYVLQQIYQQNQQAVSYRNELQMLRAIRKKFVELGIIK